MNLVWHCQTKLSSNTHTELSPFTLPGLAPSSSQLFHTSLEGKGMYVGTAQTGDDAANSLFLCSLHCWDRDRRFLLDFSEGVLMDIIFFQDL